MTTSFVGCSAGGENEEDVGAVTQNVYWAHFSGMRQWYETTPKNTMNLCVSGYFDWDNQPIPPPDPAVHCSTHADCGDPGTCGCIKIVENGPCQNVDRCKDAPSECMCYPGAKGTWSRTSTAYENTKRWYQESATEGWAKYSDMTFVWQGDCPAFISEDWVPIRIIEGDRLGAIGGDGSWGPGWRNPAELTGIQGREPESAITIWAYEGDARSEITTKTTFVHEIGHVLGMRHEQERPDRVTSLTTLDGKACDKLFKDGVVALADNTYLTPYDPDSIMNYCRDLDGDNVADGYSLARNPALTAADRTGAQALFGFPKPLSIPGRNFCTGANDRAYVGRFDSGATADVLCQSASGQLTVDLADANGRLDSDNWTLAANFCAAAGDRLLVADANGDGRDDLICNNSTSGNLAIRYATNSGTFPTLDWTRNSAFCGGATARTIVAGDFTGDKRADLLCRGPNGAIDIDFADANGQYTNINWSANQPNFCTKPQDRLIVLEADGDNRRDLVCYDPVTAQVQTQVSVYSQLTGVVFSGISVSGVPTGFPTGCTGIFPADLNGDGRDDLVCHTQDTLNVATAQPRGVYARADFKGPFGLWCNAAGDRLLGGAFRGSARADLLCLSTNGTLAEQFSLLSPYPDPTRCTVANSIDLGAPNNTMSVKDNACVMVRGGYPADWGTRRMKLQNPVWGESITDFVWSNTCSESAGSGRFTAASQDKVLDSTNQKCATFIQLQGAGFSNISLRYVSDQPVPPPCSEATAIDLGSDGNDVTVKDNACVMVRNAYPVWWATRAMKLQNPAFGGSATPFTWSNACSGSSGSDTFTAAWNTKVLNTTNSACATLIELRGTGATNLTLHYYSN